ncbi:MAG: Hsp33 family molecular chaperone HslO [Treponema sp.]|nr:Hsp33 family molecular chaperone HslO [Treponema sp.]
MNKARLDEELQKYLDTLEADGLTVFTMANGRARGALFHGSRFVNQLRAQHKLGILETYILGQACLCAAMTIPMMKDMEHNVIKYEGAGPQEGYSVEADSKGYVRGYLFTNPVPVTKTLENWDLAQFMGPGSFTFSRVHKDDKYPQSSTVDVDGDNIAKDFATYFAQSEQINTAFNSSIQFDKEGRVIGAGAMYIQVMPKTGGKAGDGANLDSHQEESEDEEKLLTGIENAFKACPSLGLLYSEKEVDSEDIIIGLFREFEPVITVKRDIIFDCPCSEEKFKNYLKTLPPQQLKEFLEESKNTIQIECRNCGSHYDIPIEDL